MFGFNRGPGSGYYSAGQAGKVTKYIDYIILYLYLYSIAKPPKTALVMLYSVEIKLFCTPGRTIPGPQQ